MLRTLAFALLLVAAGTVQAAEKRLDKTFTVTPGGVLTVDAEGATVRVTGSDANQVVVRMLVRGAEDSLEKVRLEAVQTESGVNVTMRRAERGWFIWGNWTKEEDIEVTVPRRYAVNVRTGGGTVRLTDTIGAASLRTSGGSVYATNLTGNLEARTSGGSIVVETLKGDVDADTSGGNVRLQHVDGKIRGKTSGGSVHASLVGANRGIWTRTSGGSIEVIVPKNTPANIDLGTSGGSVKSDLPVTSTEWSDNHITGSVNGGGELIYGHTSGGSVRLRAGE